MSREHALAIWQAAVDAVRPEPLVEAALGKFEEIRQAPRILVVGAGKAGPGMARGWKPRSRTGSTASRGW